MAVLLVVVDDWAHPHAASVASAASGARTARVEAVVAFIDNHARVADVFNPVMIREVYHHER